MQHFPWLHNCPTLPERIETNMYKTIHNVNVNISTKQKPETHWSLVSLQMKEAGIR